MRIFLTLTSVYLVYAVFSASWVSTGLFVVEIEKDFGIDTFKTAWLTNIVSIAKIFGSIFSAWILNKYGLKWGYILGCIFISFGAFGVNNYELMLFGRFFMGLGSAVAVVSLVPVAKALLKNPQKVLMINSSANTLGNFIGICLLGNLSVFYWKDIFVFFAIFNAILLLIFAIFSPRFLNQTKNSIKNLEKNLQNSAKLSKKDFKKVAFMIFIYMDFLFLLNICFVYLPKMDFFFSNTTNLSYFLNAINISIIACGFFLGRFFIKFKPKNIIFLTKILTLFVVFAFMFLGRFFNDFGFIFGLIFGFSYGILFSIIFILGSHENIKISTKIMSIFWAFSYGFLALNSQIFAKLFQEYGFFSAFCYFLFISLLSFLISFYNFLSPPPKKKKTIEILVNLLSKFYDFNK